MRRTKQGTMTVKGTDQVLIQTPWPVGSCEAGFSDEEPVHNFPACDAPESDSVVAEPYEGVSKAKPVYGVVIKWSVKAPREVTWLAKRS